MLFKITDQKQLIGWVQALLAILVFLGINQSIGRFSATILHVNPVIYSCAAFSSCALALLAISGPGPLAKESMRSIDTWLYGAILMCSYIVGMLLFSYVTATEGTMLQKVGVLLSLIGSWFFLGRKPDIYQIIGTFIITSAVALVCLDLKGDNIGAIYLLSFLYGSLQVSRIFVAELHRPHSKAASDNDPRSKARVVGFVMFIISTIFLIATFLVALAQEAQPGNAISGLPTLKDFLHPPTIFAGIIAGIFIVAPSRILEFSSSYTIKAENFTAVTSLSFISTLFWEWALSPLTGLSINDISRLDIFAGVLITAGGIFIALTRKYKNKQNDAWKEFVYREQQDLNTVDDSREIISNTLEHLDGDIKRAAKFLGVSLSAINTIIDDKDKTLAFKPNILKDVSRNYRKNIAARDSLTGLVNRAGFMTKLKASTFEYDTFSILYIDLDKFKPVNDTFGHEAGDFVLREVATRFGKIFSRNNTVGRLGGDEFCVLMPETDKDKALRFADKVKSEMARPILFGESEIFIGASVGISSFPEDSSKADELMKIADGSMYDEKKSR